MAIYHLSVKPISRSSGRSATAAAAYRAAERIDDQRTGQIHDYTRKGGVESADIVLPDNAPIWASDRAALWNAAELAEKRKDACVAREYEVALPAELPPAERRRLVVDFAQEMANREGCAVDVCIHAPGRGGDERNHHAHLMRTTRKVEAEGLGGKLDTEKAGRNRKQDLEAIRERWAERVNKRLREHGIQSQIDHRSLEAQGIDRAPTQHLGPAVSGMVRRGADSEVARRMAEEANARLFAAHELGRIERAIDRSILDLSGDLAGAIREREERRRKAEILKGVEHTGPAVNSARFRAKPTEKAIRRGTTEREAQGVKLSRPDFEAMPIEQQAKAFDLLQNHLAQGRQAKLDRVAQKATSRHDRRSQAARKLWEAKPQPPTGLLASFKRSAYETALGQWQKDRQRADRLKAQAEKTRDQIVYETLHDSFLKAWAKRVIERIEPELTRRVDAYKTAERAKQEEQRRQEQARQELEREFKGMALRRAMKARGYTDSSPSWQATPKLLREIIDEYNRQPKERQERDLAAWLRDTEKSKSIATLIEQRRQNTLDRGISR